MDKEKLDALLAAEAITQAEYDALAAGLPGGKEGGTPPKEEEEELARRVQQEVDKITAKLGKDKSDLQREVDRLKKEKLTEAERRELDQKEREAALAEREQAVREGENRLYAIKSIKAAGLDDGGDTALALVDFVLGEDEGAIDARVKAFGTLVSKLVRAQVDHTFKSAGREPQKGGGGAAAADNPYRKESYNLTRQMELERSNPKEAERLRAAAGT